MRTAEFIRGNPISCIISGWCLLAAVLALGEEIPAELATDEAAREIRYSSCDGALGELARQIRVKARADYGRKESRGRS